MYPSCILQIKVHDISQYCKKITFYKDDCTDLKKMTEITKNVDVVYHCAATAHEGLSVVVLEAHYQTGGCAGTF